MVAKAWLLLIESRMMVVDYLPMAWMKAGVNKSSWVRHLVRYNYYHFRVLSLICRKSEEN